MDFDQLPIVSVEGIIFHKKDFFFRSKLEYYANNFQQEFFASLKKSGIEGEFSTGVDDQGVIKISEKNQPFNAVTLSENSIGFSVAWVNLAELETTHVMFKFLAENLKRFRAEGEKLVWDFFGMRFSLVFPFIKPNAAQIIRETFFNDVSLHLEKVIANKETDLLDFHIATRDQQMRYRLRVDSSLDKKVITARLEIERPFGAKDTDISFSSFTSEAIRFYREAMCPFAERLLYNPEFNESFFKTFF